MICYSVTAQTQLEEYQQRCWLVLVLQYNLLLLAIASPIDGRLVQISTALAPAKIALVH